MKQITVEVDKRNVYNEIAKMTAYIGARDSSGTSEDYTYEKVFTVDEDRIALEGFWADACVELTKSISEYVHTTSGSIPEHGLALGNDFSVTLKMPDNYNEGTVESVKSGVFQFFVYTILSRWLSMTKRESAPQYMEMAGASISDVFRLLNSRNRPVRRW